MLLGGAKKEKKKKVGLQFFPLRALGEEQTGNVWLMLPSHINCTIVQFM